MQRKEFEMFESPGFRILCGFIGFRSVVTTIVHAKHPFGKSAPNRRWVSMISLKLRYWSRLVVPWPPIHMHIHPKLPATSQGPRGGESGQRCLGTLRSSHWPWVGDTQKPSTVGRVQLKFVIMSCIMQQQLINIEVHLGKAIVGLP